MINKTIEFSTPSLILDIDKMKKNILKMSKYCSKNNMNLRPHAKSHKMSKLAKMQINLTKQSVLASIDLSLWLANPNL